MAKGWKSMIKLVSGILITLTVAALSWAQTPDIPDKGFRPFGSYQLSDIDSVNLTNGNLIVHVPIVSYPQRGDMPPLSLSVRYNNPRWSIKFQYKGQQQFTGLDYWWALWGDDGATTEIVRDDTYSVAAYVYNAYSIDPGPGSAALHVVDSMGAHHFVANTSGDLTQGFGNTMESMDGTGLKVEGNASYVNPTIIDGNGIRHIMAGINQVDHPVRPDLGGDEERIAYAISTANGFAESTEDTNGNKISTVPGGWKDTMGRFIPAPNQFKTGCETLNFPGTNGGTVPITFCYGGTAIHSTFGLTSVIDGNYHDENYPLLQVVSSITLPNGTSWQFHYDNYGFLSSIDLPTGGTISYTWQVSQACANFLQNERNLGGSFVWGNTGSVVCDFFVTSRTFDAHDGSGPHTWTYSGDTPSNSSGRVTVTDPLGNDTIHTYTGLGGSTYETKTQYYNGPQANNQVLKTVDRQYQNTNAVCSSDEGLADNMGPSPAIVPLSTTTTWAATNQVSQSTFTYDSGASVFVSSYGSVQTCPLIYGKVIQQSEYDYGNGSPGALLRTTNTQYQWQVDSNYLHNNLLDLLHSVQVTDGSGNQVAYSYNEYDQTGLQPSGISSSQFDTNPPGAPYRGNQTTVHHWLNTTGGYLNTTTSYYDTGMPYQATDAMGKSTTYSYDPMGAYVTRMQLPTTSNGVQHTVYASYDFNTGLRTSFTDQNGAGAGDPAHTTTYGYDNMGRVTSVIGPPDPNNGNQQAQTTYGYNDTPFTAGSNTPYMYMQEKIDANNQTTAWTQYDGFGRVIRTAKLNGEASPNIVDDVDTCYDGLGQKIYQSNPYQMAGWQPNTYHCPNDPATPAGEQFAYDALGRPTTVIYPDGNTVSTAYSQFPAVTITDETGRARQNQSDALGRLIRVWEPDPATGGFLNETDYYYNSLDNLEHVVQKGNDPNSANWRRRDFQYDSLSRLTTASNPESGTFQYGYDANSNLTSKISPAPNQTGNATITYNYTYDELNRLTSRFSAGQPTEVYTYDISRIQMINVDNPIGRLVQSRSTTSAGSVSTIYSYDVMGRVEFENPYSKRGTTLYEPFSYTYNLDGSLKTMTYPSGRVINYSYNVGQRPISAVDSTNNTSFVTNAHYTAVGALGYVVNGSTSSFGGIVATENYNARLQPNEIHVAVGAQPPVLDLVYDYYSCNGNGGNNGNVCQVTNNKDSARTQAFAYDYLNRLIFAWTPNLNSSAAHNWEESFGYDIWGNLLTKNFAGSDNPPDSSLQLAVNTHNQVTNWTYDAAGNIVDPKAPQPCPNPPNPTPSGDPNFYDGLNQLTQVLVGCVTSYYDYDADGQRVKKSNGSTNTLYWHGPGGEVLEETDLNGNLQNEYVFFGGKRIARYNSTNGYSYYFADQLGSADVVTDALGNIKEESDFYPFGGERIVTDLGFDNRYKFTGKERDPETGCDYFGARYYCNPIGRFITPDWAAKPATVPYANFGNPQSLNLYSYVQNNPTTMGDPDGHCGVITCPLILGGERLAAGTASTVAAVDGAIVAALFYALTRPHTPSNLSGGNLGTIGMAHQQVEAYEPIQSSNASSQSGQQQGSGQEQGRDAQGRFLPKQPGQTQPGSGDEKKGLDSVGATKNTKPIPGGTSGTIPDGHQKQDGQYVEVKSGAEVNNSEQLRGMGKDAMAATGKPLKVVTTNPNVNVTGPAQKNPNLDIQPLDKK